MEYVAFLSYCCIFCTLLIPVASFGGSAAKRFFSVLYHTAHPIVVVMQSSSAPSSLPFLWLGVSEPMMSPTLSPHLLDQKLYRYDKPSLWRQYSNLEEPCCWDLV